ncbi:DsbC family protein [Sphaerotilus uruguayifluvii]|uniref:Thiol:disulfide interchange protein n=1 Tax=Sphaerotilus uruguayifluvii TaxID=2735897 RepID=A0ABX2G753_9BURK|nr:DsbC family protein [Leptothrix sp. C29]NRT58158.1 thiol:disulfide interchange protein DsbC [Leptothrix sp. C29]
MFPRLAPSALAACVAALGLLAATAVRADEADIRKTFAERFQNLPKIDEIRPAPVAGLWEVRIGTEVMYTDAKGSYLIQGSIIDTATRKDLTQERIDKLTAIDFASLPLKDAIVWKNGNGKRRIAVFADPNCGYCKRLEKDLVNVKDVTVYTFVIPILGGDSPEKSRSIWCAKDNTTTWRSWMIDGVAPQRAMGQCDTTAIERNAALARKHKVNGTPAIVFEDGTRAPGAIPAAEIEKRLAAQARS